MHASEMWKKSMYGQDQGFCPREYALLDILRKKRPDEFLQTSSQVTFNLGNYVATMVIDAMADIGKAVGHWKCSYCDKAYKFQKRPYKCSDCDHDKFDYIECRFTSQETGISCGVDMLLVTVEGKHKIIEIKSIKDDAFKDLKAPLVEHRDRTNLYMRIVEDSKGRRKERINTEEAIVLYVSKAGFGCKDDTLGKEGITDGPFSPFKEFIVKRDDSITDKKWYFAKVLQEYRQGKRGTPKGICGTRICDRAQHCPVVDECFSGKYEGVD